MLTLDFRVSILNQFTAQKTTYLQKQIKMPDIVRDNYPQDNNQSDGVSKQRVHKNNRLGMCIKILNINKVGYTG